MSSAPLAPVALAALCGIGTGLCPPGASVGRSPARGCAGGCVPPSEQVQQAALGHLLLHVPPASCSQGLGTLLSRALFPRGCGVPGGEGSCHGPVALCLG